MLMFSALLMLCLYSVNDVTSKCYYTSVISFLLNGFFTLQQGFLGVRMKMIYVHITKEALRPFSLSPLEL